MSKTSLRKVFSLLVAALFLASSAFGEIVINTSITGDVNGNNDIAVTGAGNSNSNTLRITSGGAVSGKAYGGYNNVSGNTASNNTLNIEGTGTVTGSIYGGYGGGRIAML